ncbi:MAG: hypothetical protein AAGC44_01685 [Planctomycetota bacterium]
MPQMSMKQWKMQLGQALPLEEVPAAVDQPSMQVLKAVNDGRLRTHAFRAVDGRVFRMVRTRDLEAYQQRLVEPAPQITMEGMKRAFSEMVDE